MRSSRETNPDTTLAVKLRASRTCINAPALALDDLLGLELHFLDAISARETQSIRLIYTSPGHLVSIGRYHLYFGPAETT